MSAILIICTVMTGALTAKELGMDISVDRNTVSLGQSMQLSLHFRDSTSVPAPDLPDMDGFSVRYVGPSTRMSIINGRMSSSITHVYRLVPVRTGSFSIGPLTFEHEGDTYISNSISVSVNDSSSSRQTTPKKEPAKDTSLKDRLFITMDAGKTEFYTNEVVPLTIKLYAGGIRARDIQYPEFNHEGFSAEQFPEPEQYKERIGGKLFDVVEFNTSVFATKTGEFELGPATLNANILLKRQGRRRFSRFDDLFGRDPFDDFFGGYDMEPVTLNSGKLDVKVMPLPDKGRPSDFNGAVGDFDLLVEAIPDEIKTGDPLTLKMTVSGSGNFNTLTAIGPDYIKDFKTYEPQSRLEDGKKVFERILIPLDSTVKEIPEISFSFFNPSDGRYRTITRGPFPIKVKSPGVKEELTIMEARGSTRKKEIFGRDIIYIKESPGSLKRKNGYLYRNIPFLALNSLPLILLITIRAVMKRRERISSDRGYARRLAAPKKAKKGIRNAEKHLQKQEAGRFYDSVFITLKEYIGDRFHMPSGGITYDTAENTLKKKNMDEKTIENIKKIFMKCDMARYAPSELGTAEMEDTLKRLKEAIDYLESFND